MISIKVNRHVKSTRLVFVVYLPMDYNYKKDSYIPRPVNAEIEVRPSIKLTDKQKQYLIANCFNWYPNFYFKKLESQNILTATEINMYKIDTHSFDGEAFEYFSRCLDTFDPKRIACFKEYTKASQLNKDLDSLARLFSSYIKICVSNMARRLRDLEKNRMQRCLPESINLDSNSFSFIEFDMEKYKHFLIDDKNSSFLEFREKFETIHPRLFEYYVKKHVFKLDEGGLNCEFGKQYKEIENTLKDILSKEGLL